MSELKDESVSLDFKEIEVKDLNDTVYPTPDLPKKLGNHLFIHASSIEMSDIARGIHKGDSVVVTKDQIVEIMGVITTQALYKPWVTQTILQYLTSKL